MAAVAVPREEAPLDVSVAAPWEASFREHMAALQAMGADVPYTESVAFLRRLVKSSLLRHADIRSNPERFLAAHRLLAELATSLGPGFWIRFTVHFNLFAGTVVALGNPDQVKLLDEFQDQGKVGCFGLTEKFAGVNSGLVVNTTCTWHPDRQMFLLDSPNMDAHKNWISQGLVADLCVAVADLRVGGRSFGPHAFLMEIRRDGQLVEGVEMGDMGVKTIGNDLDNAWISFRNVWLPKTSLLDRYGGIEGDKYVQRQQGVRTMDMIGQRLYTGRCVIARSAVVFTRSLYGSTRKYTDNKKCWAPKNDSLTLSEIPQLKALFSEADEELSKMDKFLTQIENRLAACLRSEGIPPNELVEAIATGKVKAVEMAISFCWRLKQEVGSYALMSGCGFEQLDYLQCCKFAEGDSRILMQKISRDRIKSFQKGLKGSEVEARLCEAVLEAGKRGDFAGEHLQAYELAEAVMQRTMEQFASQSAKL
uniref:Acyl-coenzyme A oxidase n=1 Tax=Alexandrium monilatum TaxID=311494 RepID=A0A7S4V4F9_9DINO